MKFLLILSLIFVSSFANVSSTGGVTQVVGTTAEPTDAVQTTPVATNAETTNAETTVVEVTTTADNSDDDETTEGDLTTQSVDTTVDPSGPKYTAKVVYADLSFDDFCGTADKKTKFLDACSDALDIGKCTECEAGSIVVTYEVPEASKDALDKMIEDKSFTNFEVDGNPVNVSNPAKFVETTVTTTSAATTAAETTAAETTAAAASAAAPAAIGAVGAVILLWLMVVCFCPECIPECCRFRCCFCWGCCPTPEELEADRSAGIEVGTYKD